MEPYYVQDIVRALGHLGCQSIDVLRVGKSYHITCLKPGGERAYVMEVGEVEQLILALTRERTRG